jgi:SAM-dependent methyltransferase
MQWDTTIYPRIRPFLPATTIVEIAPGHGRWTRFLLDYCERYIGVDLSEECVSYCQERFSSVTKADFYVNDGRSLPMVEQGEADFVFSFDSLVHAEPDVIADYVSELSVKLSPEGTGFLHHSNVGAADTKFTTSSRYASRIAKLVPPTRPMLARRGLLQEAYHWRSLSMTAAAFVEMCDRSGLRCVGQEIVNWVGPELIDCLSAVARPGSKWDRRTVVKRNPRFMDAAWSSLVGQEVFGSLSLGSSQ